MIITPGIPDSDKAIAADLYWQAFGEKLGVAMGPKEKGLAFVMRVLDPSHALSAHDDAGNLLGVVGFKTENGALVGGEFADLVAIYGYFGATWRAMLLSALERDTENKRFLMDGIFVAPDTRGQGVGTALLKAIMAEGVARGYDEVRLDVIDSNQRAHALYARMGFEEKETTSLGPLHHFFKFQTSTTMVRALP